MTDEPLSRTRQRKQARNLNEEATIQVVASTVLKKFTVHVKAKLRTFKTTTTGLTLY